MNIMLCGANDVAQLLLLFNEVSSEMEFQALNFINGQIMYHNYGNDKWVENSKLTVNNADVLVFVINSNYGQITWNIEFEEAINMGKNFVVFCEKEVYQLCRQLSNNKLQVSRNKKSKNILKLIDLFQKLEIEFQITIVPFTILDFKKNLKRELMKLFVIAIDLLEVENKKNSFLPILLSAKFNDNPKAFINPRNEALSKSILFDYFEKKEIRKKALDYFVYSKTLSETEIIKLCLDSEQGISRKAIQNIQNLVTFNCNYENIFAEVIPSIANEEVGVVRRAILSFISLDIECSIKYFNLFFPTSDVGTPRRIIQCLFERTTELKKLFKKNTSLQKQFLELVYLCLNFKSETGGWKEQAEELVKKFT